MLPVKAETRRGTSWGWRQLWSESDGGSEGWEL